MRPTPRRKPAAPRRTTPQGPRLSVTAEVVLMAAVLVQNGFDLSLVARSFWVPRTTLGRRLAERGVVLRGARRRRVDAAAIPAGNDGADDDDLRAMRIDGVVHESDPEPDMSAEEDVDGDMDGAAENASSGNSVPSVAAGFSDMSLFAIVHASSLAPPSSASSSAGPASPTSAGVARQERHEGRHRWWETKGNAS